MSDPGHNEEVVRAFVDEVTNGLDATHLDDYKDPGYRVHRFGFQNLHDLTGRAMADPADPDPLAGFRALHRAFGWHAEITAGGAVGEHVWTRMRVTGQHVGEFLGIPPSGRPIAVDEIGVRRFANGRMVEGWWMADELGLLRQIGVELPDLRA